MGQFVRTWGAGITAAVVIGSVGAAAAVASPTPHTPAVARTAVTDASATTTAKSVRAWEQFRIRGVAKNLRPGSTVTLQQKQGKRWVSLPASMQTTSRSTYSLRVMLGFKGHNKLRMVDARKRPVSPVIDVWVR